MVGLMYCSMPIIDNGMRRAAAANASSGSVVTGPAPIISSVKLGSA